MACFKVQIWPHPHINLYLSGCIRSTCHHGSLRPNRGIWRTRFTARRQRKQNFLLLNVVEVRSNRPALIVIRIGIEYSYLGVTTRLSWIETLYQRLSRRIQTRSSHCSPGTVNRTIRIHRLLCSISPIHPFLIIPFLRWILQTRPQSFIINQ